MMTLEQEQEFKKWWAIQSDGVAITYKSLLEEYAYAAWAFQQKSIDSLIKGSVWEVE